MWSAALGYRAEFGGPLSPLPAYGASAQALQLLDNARAGGLEVYRRMYEKAIELCYRDRRWPEVMHLFHAMRDRDLQPGVVCCGVACHTAPATIKHAFPPTPAQTTLYVLSPILLLQSRVHCASF